MIHRIFLSCKRNCKVSLRTSKHPTVEEGNGWILLSLCGARLFFFSCKILPKEYKSTTTITMMRVQVLSAREKYNTNSLGGTEGENTRKNPLSQTIY